MKNNDTNHKDILFKCQVSSAVLGSIESLLVHLRKEEPNIKNEEARIELLNDIQKVEDWCFESVFMPKPPLWLQCALTSMNVAVLMLATIGFLKLT